MRLTCRNEDEGTALNSMSLLPIEERPLSAHDEIYLVALVRFLRVRALRRVELDAE